MKSILKVLLNWKNWNNREVGNTYRFVSEDNFLYVHGSFTKKFTIKATIGGVEQEITRMAILGYTTDQVAPGTVVTVTWEDGVIYLQVNDRIVFGVGSQNQYYYQTKTDAIAVDKSTGDGEVHVDYYDNTDVSRDITIASNTPMLRLNGAKIGGAVHIAWESTVSYLKVNDKVIVG